jgi:YidC/Oxa1 family membrane protein insertase
MWNTLIINPLLSTLHTLLNFSGDIGVAIVLMTVLIKTLLLPLNISSSRTQKNIKKIQSKVDELKEKHKGDLKTHGIELQKLYKEHQIKPFSSLLNILLQFPILIGLYQILLKEVASVTDKVTYFGINITEHNYLLAIISFLSMLLLMFISTKELANTNSQTGTQFQKDFNKMMVIQMRYFLPILILVTSIFLPAGIVIYFIVSNVFGVFQYYFLEKINK